MTTFQVDDMTCGHCASAISRAIAAVDKNARMDIRIQQKRVRVASSATTAELAEAIQGAGYTPREIQDEEIAAAPEAKRGCGCGCAPVGARAPEVRQAAAPATGACCG